ncbi:MAG TPA: HAMP domain-containing sensor histidine kinase [Actinomycetota bacterium]|nr:HAMP domain-containing sensor histidine kinase [Actinomycetota bacterium]
MTLRLKLLIAVIVMVFAGLAVADVVTYTSLKRFLFQRVDQQLVAGASPVKFALNNQGGGGPQFPGPATFATALLPPGTYGEARDADGALIRATEFSYGALELPHPALPQVMLPSRAPDSGDPGFFDVASTAGSSLQYRVMVQRVPLSTGAVGLLVVAIPLTELGTTLGRLLLIEALVTVLVVVGLGFVSWWLVRRELRPLAEIGQTAGAIAAGDLSQRVPARDPRTEVGQLGVALNAMLAQIEEAFAERKASEDRLRRFLADASHELRTPLTSIRGYAELFRRGARGRKEDLAKSLRRIEDESSRMGVIVEDLLLLARLDQDRPLEVAALDLAAVAADAVEDARAFAGDREISLDVDGPVPLVGDEARLRQVAANLLANAVVHTPDGTPISVRTRVEDGGAILEVADRGPGLSPEQVAKAFEPFYRSDPSRDRATGGAGLGLAIVAAITKAHGGTVDVSQTPGGGATFRVSIPRRGADQQAPSEEDAAGTE